MVNGRLDTNNRRKEMKEGFAVHITEPMLYDRLHILSAEYDISVEELVNIAVSRLIGDVDFVRRLRNGETEWE